MRKTAQTPGPDEGEPVDMNDPAVRAEIQAAIDAANAEADRFLAEAGDDYFTTGK